ncbi:MAG TPA: hypothetical protein VHB21_09585 [Minicystis sp.]|nr:hypothetical protein [Minicystis sp.]
MCAARSTVPIFRRCRARTCAKVASALVVSCALGGTRRAAAAPPEDTPLTRSEASALREVTANPGGFVRLSGAVEIGDGLRFDNPYRLSTELGGGSAALSRTSSYVDLAASLTYGPARGLAHGFAVHLSLGLEGLGQQVVTPSYELEYRPRAAALLYGRFGTPVVLTPDPGMGFELAAGFGWFVTARVAVAGELVGDLFYGAGTLQSGVTTYPILSGQLGLLFEQELLPW